MAILTIDELRVLFGHDHRYFVATVPDFTTNLPPNLGECTIITKDSEVYVAGKIAPPTDVAMEIL